MPQDPNALTIPGGAQFLTAPNGTMAPTEGTIFGNPVEVDLTGLPILAAPNRTGSAASLAVIGPSLVPPLLLNQVLVTGLYNVSPDDVFDPTPGATNTLLLIAGTQLNPVGGPADGAPLPNTPNSGFFRIITVVDQNTVIAQKVLPVPPNATAIQPSPPDLANGQIAWAMIRNNTSFESVQFAQGDPLSYLTKLVTQFNIVSPAPGPARFTNYDPTVPPVVVNDDAGLFNKVQRA